jgi:tRNA(Ile)-lysidine synthetase-like protein
MVVAVSGGADSLCLLDALVAVVPDASHRLMVGHVDHQLRPQSSDDAKYVTRVAEDLGLRTAVVTVNVPALAEAERLGIEEAARLARYRSVAGIADEWETDAVLTGHTLDDSVETIALNFLRGTGARGLSGIAEREWLPASWLGAPPARPVGLGVFRPLLRVRRAETVAYCEARGLRYLTDESNADPRFTRNRVRAHLLPVLRTYNPSIDPALARMARLFQDEDAWLLNETARRSAALRVDPGVGGILSLGGWQREPLPMQRRIVRLIAESLGVADLGFEAVERALAVGHNDGPRRADLGRGLAVERRQDTLIFQVERDKQINREGDQHP